MSVEKPNPHLDRRSFMEKTTKGLGFFLLGSAAGKLISNSVGEGMIWQIDPLKCTQCGNCATACVLTPSASKCVHELAMCGYCRVCTGFFPTDPPSLDEGAENQLCPVGAIKRSFVEEPYYEYTIDKQLCIGCARCVKGCTSYGNGSLYMQIDRNLCVNCNQCAIALVCEGKAIHRIPAKEQYLPKGKALG
jgi:Na+-translocating ferredoxin:NAD+ oxidoreductase subunit B